MTTWTQGFDGNGIKVGDRVELHPANDLWMRGARFGTVLKVGRVNVTVLLDVLARRRTIKAHNIKVIF